MNSFWRRWGVLACTVMALTGCGAIDRLFGHKHDPADVPIQKFKCESKGEIKYCDVDASAGVRLLKKLSKTPCIRGRTWDYGRFGVWVNHGCRGEFLTGAGDDDGGSFDPKQNIVRCESKGGDRKHCPIEVEPVSVELLRQVSKTKCEQNKNWGWDPTGIWVTGGCRATFRVR